MVIVGMLLVGGVAIGSIVMNRNDEAPAPPAAMQTATTATMPTDEDTARPDLASEALAVPAQTDDIPAAIRELRAILELEVKERQRLEEKVARLEGELSGEVPQAGLMSAEDRERFKDARARRDRRRVGLSEDSLTEAGLDPQTAALLKSRVDELAMERLYMRDNATREGWLNSQRFRDEMRRMSDVRQVIRDDFGDQAYDSYLFAMGRPNRLSVDNVIANSPAQISGLQAGDRLLRYDGQRIYNQGELSRGTSGGRAGEMVPVQLMRDGNMIDIYIPRGPLGVNLSNLSEKP